MKIQNKCIVEPYSFLVNYTTLPSGDPLRFRKNLLDIIKLHQLINKIKAKKAQYSLDIEAVKFSAALSSGKCDKYEYLTGGEMIPKSELIEKTRFEYSLLGQIFIKVLD